MDKYKEKLELALDRLATGSSFEREDGRRIDPNYMFFEPSYEVMSAGYDATRLLDGTPQFADAGFCIGHARAIYIAMRKAEAIEETAGEP